MANRTLRLDAVKISEEALGLPSVLTAKDAKGRVLLTAATVAVAVSAIRAADEAEGVFAPAWSRAVRVVGALKATGADRPSVLKAIVASKVPQSTASRWMERAGWHGAKRIRAKGTGPMATRKPAETAPAPTTPTPAITATAPADKDGKPLPVQGSEGDRIQRAATDILRVLTACSLTGPAALSALDVARAAIRGATKVA